MKPFKNNINQLAIFGGKPEFERQLHVGQPVIADREKFIARLNGILDSGWFTNNGHCVQQFEKGIADRVGVQHCVAMANGTISLQLLIEALELTGEVILPSFTFVATAHAVQWQKLKPVFCDIDPRTGCINPTKVEALITPRTTAIIGVHVWGNACDIEALSRIAVRHKVKLIFDAAHALGCSYKRQMIGNFGDAEIFSFHATKFVNAFEGGAVVTNNDLLAEKLRRMRNFGFEGKDKVSALGINAKMCEVAAAMGLTSLEKMENTIAINYRNYKCYRRLLTSAPGLQLVAVDENEQHNYQYVAVRNDSATSGVTRDQLVAALSAENILARRYFYPGCHNMEPYRSLYPEAGRGLSETSRLSEEAFCLPTGEAIDENDVGRICAILALLTNNAPALNEYLSPRKSNRSQQG